MIALRSLGLVLLSRSDRLLPTRAWSTAPRLVPVLQRHLCIKIAFHNTASLLWRGRVFKWPHYRGVARSFLSFAASLDPTPHHGQAAPSPAN